MAMKGQVLVNFFIDHWCLMVATMTQQPPEDPGSYMLMAHLTSKG